ncbi:MAG: hypothetical protein DWQ44_03480 [Bacteroidetes bacterium]|nr:MAG: hypothetical protein DWQ33_04320 [Bacteroidota bacterium]REK35875.1 MAG: hypothetical protein DWQ44_03480 [Bacteroidota bacterium]REK50648.1 MAG: hypothetical protein DWQ48_04885 [Bacteroidota bacterium]
MRKGKKRAGGILLGLFCFVAGMLIRKSGINAGSLIMISGIIILVFYSAVSGLLQLKKHLKHDSVFAIPMVWIYALSLALLALKQQYWIVSEGVEWISLALVTVALLLPRLIPTLNKHIIPTHWRRPVSTAFWFVCITLLVLSLSLNDRDFHNFFRASTYEQMIRNRYPERKKEKAAEQIAKMADRSEKARIRAELFLDEARKLKAKGDINTALKKYNLSIDLNPFNAQAYFERGHLKLHKLEINNETAASAAYDFTLAISINDSVAQWYFERAVALSYLDVKFRVCEDLNTIKRLAPEIDTEFLRKKNCPSGLP